MPAGRIRALADGSNGDSGGVPQHGATAGGADPASHVIRTTITAKGSSDISRLITIRSAADVSRATACRY
jgi:hypothetical protein